MAAGTTNVGNENNSLKGELVTLFTNIEVGSAAAQERDVLGHMIDRKVRELSEGDM